MRSNTRIQEVVVRSKSQPEKIEGHLQIEVSDQGIGLPDGFAIDQPRASLGFKVIAGMARQLQGHLTIAANHSKGAHFLLDLPILPKTL